MWVLLLAGCSAGPADPADTGPAADADAGLVGFDAGGPADAPDQPRDSPPAGDDGSPAAPADTGPMQQDGASDGSSSDGGEPDLPEPDEGPPPCEPVCEPGACADDGCGGTCGPCSAAAPWCFVGWCQADEPPQAATLLLTPALVDFGPVAPGSTASTEVLAINPSLATVTVDSFSVTGDPAFKVEVAGKDWWSWVPTGITVALGEPWVLLPGDERLVPVRFEPDDGQAVGAALRLFANLPDAPEGVAVQLRGGEPYSCLEVSPVSLELGAALMVGEGGAGLVGTLQLRSCGTLPVDVVSLELSEDSASAGFSLTSPPALPLALEPEESLALEITFQPELLGPAVSELVVGHSAGPDLAASITGVGVDEPCAHPQISFGELSPVDPFTIVHHDGTPSFSPGGPIETWSWVLQQPPGSVTTLLPSATAPKGTTQLDVVGAYRFVLDVTDASGVAACSSALAVIETTPPTTMWIELVWDTPADADPTDQGPFAGADLDLHLTHPAAVGADLDGDGQPDGWFDALWDCSWQTPHPDWGDWPPPTVDDPILERSDADGFGPEAISMDLMEEVDYGMGVHYWADYGYGPSTATVRVYNLGFLIWESQPVTLQAGDFWEVGSLRWLGWPDAEVLPAEAEGGGPVIIEGVEP